jgi:hypothetical protein
MSCGTTPLRLCSSTPHRSAVTDYTRIPLALCRSAAALRSVRRRARASAHSDGGGTAATQAPRAGAQAAIIFATGNGLASRWGLRPHATYVVVFEHERLGACRWMGLHHNEQAVCSHSPTLRSVDQLTFLRWGRVTEDAQTARETVC